MPGRSAARRCDAEQQVGPQASCEDIPLRATLHAAVLFRAFAVQLHALTQDMAADPHTRTWFMCA